MHFVYWRAILQQLVSTGRMAGLGQFYGGHDLIFRSFITYWVISSFSSTDGLTVCYSEYTADMVFTNFRT